MGAVLLYFFAYGVAGLQPRYHAEELSISALQKRLARKMNLQESLIHVTPSGGLRVHVSISVPEGSSSDETRSIARDSHLEAVVADVLSEEPSIDEVRIGDVTVTKLQVQSGAGDTSYLEGDPHVMNMQGEKFDILRAGGYSILQIPRDASPENTFLSVLANIERANKKWCESMFIDKVTIVGKWLGTQKRLAIAAGKLGSREPLAFQLGHENRPWQTFARSIRAGEFKYVLDTSEDMPSSILEAVTVNAGGRGGLHTSRHAFKATVGPISITVSLVQHPHFHFLNLDADGLHELAAVMKIGGILGLDSHAEALNPDAHGCKSKVVELRREDRQKLLRHDGIFAGGLRGSPDQNSTLLAAPEDTSVLYDPAPLSNTGLGSTVRAV